MPQRISKAKIHRDANYRWYSTHKLIALGATYHPGNYLRNIHNMLHFLAAASLIAMWGLFWNELKPNAYAHPFDASTLISPAVTIPVMLLGTTAFFISQFIRQTAGRVIRERELLSIQSSAVVWRAVITCHILAVEWMLREKMSYRGYTKALSKLAMNLNANFYQIHDWLKEWEEAYCLDGLHAKLTVIIDALPPDDPSEWGRYRKAQAKLAAKVAELNDLLNALRRKFTGKLKNTVGWILLAAIQQLIAAWDEHLEQRVVNWKKKIGYDNCETKTDQPNMPIKDEK